MQEYRWLSVRPYAKNRFLLQNSSYDYSLKLYARDGRVYMAWERRSGLKVNYKFVIGGPDSKMKKSKWKGIPQRGEIPNGVGVNGHTKR